MSTTPVNKPVTDTSRWLVAAAVFAAAAIGAVQTARADLATAGEQIYRDRPQFADLIEEVKPAVVNISVTKTVGTPFLAGRPNHPNTPGSPFDEFFRRFFEGPPGSDPDGRSGRRARSVGSGFIIDPSGFVVTNYHVIHGAEEIAVVMNDGSEYDAVLHGRDPKTDLALLKVQADQPLPFVAFGDSNRLRVGDWVVAIGNPFGLGGTATAGIVSARGRDIQSGPFDDFIQIDAPINRGNSGGPVFDMAGRVVGINTAIYSPNGGSVGIGFAIPASQAESIIAELRHDGRVKRGWLGVGIQAVTKDIADGLGLDEQAGALVSKVEENSPAEEAGLQPGDVILRFAGKEVTHIKDLTRLVADTDENEGVDVFVWRDGRQRKLTVEIGILEDSEVTLAAEETAEGSGQLGLQLAPIDASARTQYGLSETVEGALIVGVRNDSPAAVQGLRGGDIIAQVGSQEVTGPTDVIDEVERARTDGKKSVVMLVRRGEGQRFVALSLA